MRTIARVLVVSLLGLGGFAQAQGSAVQSLFQADVANAQNQEIVVLEVTYPPGHSSTSHRHNAHTVVYVLEGTVKMAVAGGDTRTLNPGDVFYENPDDVHTVSMNASDTEPAKILVFFLKEKGAAATEPAD
jgi:quercetin dioxygenase-like cupin family protein